MKSGMLALMTILGSADALLVQGSGATRPSVRSNTATQSGKAAAALTSAVAAFASAPAAMAAMDSGADLGSIQSFAVELDAITTAVGLPVEQIGIAVAGIVVVGGGGYYLQQQGEEKAQVTLTSALTLISTLTPTLTLTVTPTLTLTVTPTLTLTLTPRRRSGTRRMRGGRRSSRP